MVNIIFRNLKYSLPVLLIILFIILVKVQNRVTCTITPAVLNTSDVEASRINLTWTSGQNSQLTYLNVSSSKSLKPDGSLLEDADIVNDVVTGKNSFSKNNLSPGTYYWNIISDGCGQRKVSGLGTFTIQPTLHTDCEITPAILNTPVIKDSKVTFSWTNSQNIGASYINISTSNLVNADGILRRVDVANDIVSDKNSFTKENLPPGTYYWNIASDGCQQRKISKLGSFTIQSSSE